MTLPSLGAALRGLVALIGLPWISTVAALALLQDRLVFVPPWREFDRARLDALAPADHAVPVDFDAADGTPLYGWFVAGARAAGDAPRVVIQFHGQGDVCAVGSDMHAKLASWGFDVFAPTYRGYPGAEGRPTEDGLGLDALGAWHWARERYPADRIVVYGRSLGGGPALQLAAGPARPAAVVLESTFSSITEVARFRFFPAAPLVPWLLRTPYDSAARARKLDMPVFVTHGTDDWVVPVDIGGRALRDAVIAGRSARGAPAGELEYHEVTGYGHFQPGILEADQEVADALRRFLDRAVPARGT